jgi:hypothetical protein
VGESLARAEERRKMLKRAVTPITTIVLLGLGAFAITRILAPPPPKDAPKTVDSVASAKPPVPTVQSAPLPINSAAPRATSIARVAAVPTTSASAKKEPKKRVVTLPSISPPAGVRGTLDGKSLGDDTEIASGYSVVLDENPHTLELRCMNDMCIHHEVNVPAGDQDVQWQRVALRIRDAVLIVDGPSSGVYGIKEKTDVDLQAGAKANVPMSTGSENVTVVERQSGKTVSVSLHPGVAVHADFTSLVPQP